MAWRVEYRIHGGESWHRVYNTPRATKHNTPLRLYKLYRNAFRVAVRMRFTDPQITEVRIVEDAS